MGTGDENEAYSYMFLNDVSVQKLPAFGQWFKSNVGLVFAKYPATLPKDASKFHHKCQQSLQQSHFIEWYQVALKFKMAAVMVMLDK